MPELPEVETILRGIKPHVAGQKIIKIAVRNKNLRWPVPKAILSQTGKILDIQRRGKYLLFLLPSGTLLLHLGMSGNLQIVSPQLALRKHDHVDIFLSSGQILRFNDPRRFGALLWADGKTEHPLLKNVGIEPLSPQFNTSYLYIVTRGRKVPLKSLLMNSKIVAGVGNIYASESLYLAKLHPLLPAGNLTRPQCQQLVKAVKQVLRHAIQQGGTTLKDYTNATGQPGYFSIALHVYDRAGEPCDRCGHVLKQIRIGQRSTVFCPNCQVL